MKTIVNATTGEVLYSTSILPLNLLENEVAIDLPATGNFYNFETKEFYD